MKTHVISIGPESSLSEAAKLMYSRNVGALPVVDEDERCIGIITERDILRLSAQGVQFNKLVSEFMVKDLITVSPDTTVYEALSIMSTHNIRHLPVVERGGRLVGIVSIRDLMVVGVED